MTGSKLIDSHEAQKILFFWQVETIQKYASDGKLPSVKLGGRTFYRESELREFASNLINERKGGIKDEHSGNSK